MCHTRTNKEISHACKRNERVVPDGPRFAHCISKTVNIDGCMCPECASVYDCVLLLYPFELCKFMQIYKSYFRQSDARASGK